MTRRKKNGVSYRDAAHFQNRVRHFVHRHAVVLSKPTDCNALKRLERREGHIIIWMSRRHYLHDYFEELFPVRREPRRTQPNNTTWGGGVQTSFARVAYVTQESRIGIDELANLISVTSVETENTRR